MNYRATAEGRPYTNMLKIKILIPGCLWDGIILPMTILRSERY